VSESNSALTGVKKKKKKKKAVEEPPPDNDGWGATFWSPITAITTGTTAVVGGVVGAASGIVGGGGAAADAPASNIQDSPDTGAKKPKSKRIADVEPPLPPEQTSSMWWPFGAPIATAEQPVGGPPPPPSTRRMEASGDENDVSSGLERQEETVVNPIGDGAKGTVATAAAESVVKLSKPSGNGDVEMGTRK
jgi:hypothetical protein